MSESGKKDKDKIFRFRNVDDPEEFEGGKRSILTVNFTKLTFNLTEEFVFTLKSSPSEEKDFYGTLKRTMDGKVSYNEVSSHLSLEKSKMVCIVIEEVGGEKKEILKEVGPTVYRFDKDTENLEPVAWPGKIRWWVIDEDDEDDW